MYDPAKHEADLAFLRQVLADPQDDNPRLIYADWLEERGEPRAAFIRHQLRLAGMNLRPDERLELEERADALYWKHHRYWNGQLYRQWIGTPLEGRAAHERGVRGWTYQRGFPEILEVNAECLVAFPDLLTNAAPFRELILRRLPQPHGDFLREHIQLLERFDVVRLPGDVSRDDFPTELSDRLRRPARIVPAAVRGAQPSPSFMNPRPTEPGPPPRESLTKKVLSQLRKFFGQ